MLAEGTVIPQATAFHGEGVAVNKRVRVKVSFIVPVYNEEKNVLEVIRRLQALDVPKEIIVVNDGSFDSTPDLLRTLKNAPDVVVHISQLR